MAPITPITPITTNYQFAIRKLQKYHILPITSLCNDKDWLLEKSSKGKFDPASPYGCAVTRVATWLVTP